jgi:hypothetical protein
MCDTLAYQWKVLNEEKKFYNFDPRTLHIKRLLVESLELFVVKNLKMSLLLILSKDDG